MIDPARLRMLFSILETQERLGIWLWDPRTNELVWSDGFYDLLGLAPASEPSFEEFLGHVDEADRETVEAALAKARADRSDASLTCTIGRRRIYLRLVQTPDGLVGIARDITSARARQPTGRRGRVLVVDDEPLFAASLRRLLKSEHEVTVVHDGLAALALVRGGERFDVILSDMMMPNLTGSQLHAELLALAPDQAARMIFITGGTLGRDAFLETTTNLWFEKPCDVQILRAAVRRRVDEGPDKP